MSQDTRQPSPTGNLIAKAIKESFEQECFLLSPTVQGMLQQLMRLGDPDLITELVCMFTAPEYTHRLFALIDRVPLATLLAADWELPRLLEQESHVHALITDSTFVRSPGTQVELCAYEALLDQTIILILQPIKEAWEHIPHEEPLIPFLNPWPRKRVARHQPETAFIVLLDAHFRQHSPKPRYEEIAKAVNVLFLTPRGEEDISAEQVRDRIRKFVGRRRGRK